VDPIESVDIYPGGSAAGSNGHARAADDGPIFHGAGESNGKVNRFAAADHENLPLVGSQQDDLELLDLDAPDSEHAIDQAPAAANDDELFAAVFDDGEFPSLLQEADHNNNGQHEAQFELQDATHDEAPADAAVKYGATHGGAVSGAALNGEALLHAEPSIDVFSSAMLPDAAIHAVKPAIGPPVVESNADRPAEPVTREHQIPADVVPSAARPAEAQSILSGKPGSEPADDTASASPAAAPPENIHPAAGSMYVPSFVTECRALRKRSKRSWWRRLFG